MVVGAEIFVFIGVARYLAVCVNTGNLGIESQICCGNAHLLRMTAGSVFLRAVKLHTRGSKHHIYL